MALVDELRGYALALKNEAAGRADYPLADCAETMLKAANEIERLRTKDTRPDCSSFPITIQPSGM